MNRIAKGKDTLLTDMWDLDLAQTLDCGQCFRFYPVSNSCYEGVAADQFVRIHALGGGSFLFEDTSVSCFDAVWAPYFDLGRDYGALKAQLSTDETLARAVAFAPGIRVLRQNAWEALCSFIISQNNNVPRIKGIIQRLCVCFGKPLSHDVFAFPTPQTIASCSEDDLAPIRCGFRARYLLDAARRIASGRLDLEEVSHMELSQARAALMEILGVGPKVADCALLYGFGRLDVCPMDVWMKRVAAQLYPDGFPACTAGVLGIAQQFLFHYVRCCPDALARPVLV